MELEKIKKVAEGIKANISTVLVGKDDVVDLVIISLFCAGHVLVEDVPGVGKTMLAKCLARSLDCDFKRIQFTPDLLPSDITGINYFNQKQGEFVFRPGPVFSNILLADEINRATPRTQSSLLECMEEGQVTVDGETRKLKSPFFVIATQNPVETRGTFPLPEAQLDRFFMRVKMGYPSQQEGLEILQRFMSSDPVKSLETIASARDITDIQRTFSEVRVSDAVLTYIINLVEATRTTERISLGVSPRGSIALMKAAQVNAILNDRDYVIPDDVKRVAIPVLAHRIVLRGHAIDSGTEKAEAAIRLILEQVHVPTEDI
jgi:MoxR-like ATPase